MTHINQRRDIATNWTIQNPVLQLGEFGWETDTLKAKLGDGVTAWNSLDYSVEPLENLLAASVTNGDTTHAPSGDAVFDAITAAVVGLWDDRGSYDASSNVFPSLGGSGPASAILKGDLWTISVGGTLGGSAVVPGDTVRALVDTPGQTASNWAENTANKSTDGTMAANSATLYPSQSAAKAYADGRVSDTAYAGSWDGVTGIAPSKNAVYDAVQAEASSRTTGDGTNATNLANHISDATDAHAASAITNTPAGGISATTVQAALDELDTEKAPKASPALTGAPTAPTAPVGTDTTQLATTAFIQAKFLTATAVLDFGDVATYLTARLTMTVTGAAVGDAVFVGPPSSLNAGLGVTAFVSAANTVTIELANMTVANINPASATWRAVVMKTS
jgi:hypothetical protein